MKSANQSSVHRAPYYPHLESSGMPVVITPPRRRCAPPLAWLFAALALSCLAPANAMAQTCPTAVIDLGIANDFIPDYPNSEDSTSRMILICRTILDGKTYYVLDTTNSDSISAITHYQLNTLLNDGAATIATQEGNHDGSDDERSAIIGKYTLVLPTTSELKAIRDHDDYRSLHSNVRGSNIGRVYRSANRLTHDVSGYHYHERYDFGAPSDVTGAEDTTIFYDHTASATLLQVLPAPSLPSLNEHILTRTSQAMTASTLAAVARRVDAAAGGAGASVAATPTLAYQLGGQSSLRGLFDAHGRAMLEGEMEYGRLLDGASFVLPLQATDGATNGNQYGVSSLSLWGGTDYRSLDGDNLGDDDLDDDKSGLDWGGGVFSLHFGIDGRVSQQIMAGIALSLNESSFGYKDDIAGDGGDGKYQYRSTNIHPYIGWYPTDDWKLWATLGYGQSNIEKDPDNFARNDRVETDGEQLSLSGGFSTRLSSIPANLLGGTTSWSLKGDVSLVQVAVANGNVTGVVNHENFVAEDVDSQRLRLLVSGEQNRKTTSGGVLTPSLEAGVRLDGAKVSSDEAEASSDGGDSESSTGVELAGGLRYTSSGGDLTMAVNIRLLANDSYNEYGAFSVHLLPQSGRGLSLSLNPIWGDTHSTTEQLWNNGVSETAGGDTAVRGSVDTEVGYGMEATMLGSPGLLTPYAGMTATEGGTNRLRLGSRFAGGNGLSLNLEGAQKNTTDGASHQVLLHGEVAF